MTLDCVLTSAWVSDAESRQLLHEHMSKQPVSFDEDPSGLFAKKYTDGSFVVPPHSFIEGFLDPSIIDPDRQYVWDFRSSRGRLGLRPHSQHIEWESGLPKITFYNENPNPIRLHLGKKVLQLFHQPKEDEVAQAYDVFDPDEAKEIASSVCENPTMDGPFFLLHMGETVRKFKSNRGILDSENMPEDSQVYEVINTKKGYVQQPGDCIIMSLEPKLTMPENVGLRIFHQMPYSQRSGLTRPDHTHLFSPSHSLNAGWVDQGYS